MPIYKAPSADISSITTTTGHQFDCVDGLIDTGEAPPAAVAELEGFHRCVPASDADVARADEADVTKVVQEHLKRSRADVAAELKRRGIPFDGRASMRQLTALIDEADAAEQEPAKEPIAQDTGPSKGDAGDAGGAADDKGGDAEKT